MSIEAYRDIISASRGAFQPSGFDGHFDLPSSLFDHQRAAVEFALRAGASAMFLDTGLGKTRAALSWGQEVVRRTNRAVLMLAPLGVTRQHKQEADDIGIDAIVSRDGSWSGARIVITNYERLHLFNPADFAGIILDESSILKSFSGQTTKRLIELFSQTPYRLACTATPAPNDHTELGTHAEFLGVMTRDQMLMRWFLHDSADTGTWRLKGHGVRPFWDWVASWARCVSKPSDLGFSDVGFEMPELRMQRHLVEADRLVGRGQEKDGQAHLFRLPDMSATSIHEEKRLTCRARAEMVASIVATEPGEPWTIWVETDYDADAVMAAIPGAVEVRGSMTPTEKEDRLTAFTNGELPWLVTKASIAGFGLNWQHCARTVFAGMSFSYEAFYQAVRRHWRFRQTRPVDCHVVFADTEAAIWDVVSRKAGDHDAMKREMMLAMSRAHRAETRLHSYQPQKSASLPAWVHA
ncbi:DEAD/DEAH box helicase [Bosea sp. ASV33]|uniref:helicase-related protein n=1 Tax=Bosea sp. ASV33 TaxID=2795106 RepID=UPI0018EAF065|nr:DEAD/DEAH box helicase [Bosea sp. ASV33]